MTVAPKIQSLERALNVLGMFGPQSPTLSLSEIADALGAYPSTTHRLLLTLEEASFLRRDEATNRYQLGPRLLELAGHVLAQYDMRAIAVPRMRKLVDAVGETAGLCYYERGEIVFMDTIPGTHPVMITLRVGGRAQAHCAAGGRAILAHLPDEAERLAATDLSKCGAGVDYRGRRLLRELDGIRDRGFSYDEGTYLDGINAAAAAILDHEDRPVAGLVVTGPAVRLPRRRLLEVGAIVREAAADVSTELRSKARAVTTGD